MTRSISVMLGSAKRIGDNEFCFDNEFTLLHFNKVGSTITVSYNGKFHTEDVKDQIVDSLVSYLRLRKNINIRIINERYLTSYQFSIFSDSRKSI